MSKTAIKERPIIFTGDNVLKIMRGEKTQTRWVWAISFKALTVADKGEE